MAVTSLRTAHSQAEQRLNFTSYKPNVAKSNIMEYYCLSGCDDGKVTMSPALKMLLTDGSLGMNINESIFAAAKEP